MRKALQEARQVIRPRGRAPPRAGEQQGRGDVWQNEFSAAVSSKKVWVRRCGILKRRHEIPRASQQPSNSIYLLPQSLARSSPQKAWHASDTRGFRTQPLGCGSSTYTSPTPGGDLRDTASWLLQTVIVMTKLTCSWFYYTFSDLECGYFLKYDKYALLNHMTNIPLNV